MYEQFFEMIHTPFTRDVPPEALYESPAMRDALGRLAYVADRQLFAVVTADAGCGKSTLGSTGDASISWAWKRVSTGATPSVSSRRRSSLSVGSSINTSYASWTKHTFWKKRCWRNSVSF